MRTLFPEKFVSLKRNSIIRKQFMRERLNLGSQSNAYTKISCKSLWNDVNSPRKAWFVQPSQTVNMQWVQAVLRNGHPKRNTGSAKRGEPEDVISYVKYRLSRLHCPLQYFLTYRISRTFRVQGSSHKKKKNSSRECKRLETIERLKGHSQLWDCADLDTTFVSLKSVYHNPKSNVRLISHKSLWASYRPQ